MNTIYRIGEHYVRAHNVASALAIARRAADNESRAIKAGWLSYHPIKAPAYANQYFGNAGYDNAVENETLGMVERFAQKAISNSKRKGYSLNERRRIETAASNLINELFGV